MKEKSRNVHYSINFCSYYFLYFELKEDQFNLIIVFIESLLVLSFSIVKLYLFILTFITHVIV